MTLKDKVKTSAWTLAAGWFAALLCVVVASVVSATSPLHRIAVAGSIVFGSLVAFGFAWFFAVMVHEVSEHHRSHQDLLFVSERDRLIDRSKPSAAPPAIRFVPAPPVTLQVSELAAFDQEVQQAFTNGENPHES